MRRAVIFDIDNTLIDTQERFSLCEKEAKGSKNALWQCYFSGEHLELDKPISSMIRLLKAYKHYGYEIVLITGRPLTTKEYTEKQLQEFGIEYDIIIYREDGDYSFDFLYKATVVEKLMTKYEIIRMYDDSDKVRKYLAAKLHIQVFDPKV